MQDDSNPADLHKSATSRLQTVIASRTWRFGLVEFNEYGGELRLNGSPVVLERKPREMLKLFLQRAGELVTKSELLEDVWSGRIVSESAMTNCVGKLRSAIGDNDGNILRTVHGYGYRFVASVHLDAPEPDDVGKYTDPVASQEQSQEAAALSFPPGWRFEKLLSSGVHGEAWLAVEERSGMRQRLNIARSDAGLDHLRRAAELNRLLVDRLAEQSPALPVVVQQLDAAPPYLGYDYRLGVSVQSWVDNGGAGRDRVQCLGLLIRIVGAIADLHALGILHRRLRPESFTIQESADGTATVLLSDLNQSVALDIGDAPVEASSETSQKIYLAPELSNDQPHSFQSDVYALGIIAFQVLTNDFLAVPMPGWQERIDDELLCEDIAAAVANNPERRIGGAPAFVERLRQLGARRSEREHIQRREAEAIATERALAVERGRRPLLIGLIGALILGLGASLWFGWKAVVAERIARQAAIINKAQNDFLIQDLLAPANKVPGHAEDTTIGTLLNRASSSLDQRFANQPLMQALMRSVLGQAYAALIEPEKAIPLLLSAEQSLSQLLGPAALQTEAVRATLQELYLNTALTTTRLDAVKAVAQRQVDAESKAGTPHPAVRIRAQAALDGVACWQRAGIMRGADCGHALDRDLTDAMHQLGSEDPLTLRLAVNKAVLTGVGGDVDGALPVLEKTLMALEKRYGADSPQLSVFEQEICKALEYGGAAAKTIPLLQHIASDFSVNLGPRHPYLWNAQRALGMAYVAQGDYAQAVQIQSRELVSVGQRYGQDSRQYLTALRFLVAAEVPADRLDAAISHADEGLKLAARVQTDPYDAMELRDLLGSADEKRGNVGDAIQILRENLLMSAREAPGADVPVGRYALHLAQVLLDQNQRQEVQRLVAQARTRLSRVLPPDAPLLLQAQQLEAEAGGSAAD